MKLLERRRAVAQARDRLQRERSRWHTQSQTWRARIARHRNALIVGGGVASGFVAGLLPWSAFARVGGILAATASFVLRSPIGALLAEDLRQRAPTDSSPPSP
jgi:predicted lipid-binding transport protein (Tim44 family)